MRQKRSSLLILSSDEAIVTAIAETAVITIVAQEASAHIFQSEEGLTYTLVQVDHLFGQLVEVDVLTSEITAPEALHSVLRKNK